MATWVKIKELFKDHSRYHPEPEKLFIGYTPDYGEVTLNGEETGAVDESGKPISQTIKTEMDLGGWHPALTEEGKVILVPHNATETKLTIMGKLGYENSKEVLQKIGASCYSNKALKTEGAYPTLALFEGLSEWLQFTAKEIYWLAEKNREKFVIIESFYVLYVDGSDVNYLYNYGFLYCLIGRAGSASYALRPYINLLSNILVDIGDKYCDGSTPERPMRIKLL